MAQKFFQFADQLARINGSTSLEASFVSAESRLDALELAKDNLHGANGIAFDSVTGEIKIDEAGSFTIAGADISSLVVDDITIRGTATRIDATDLMVEDKFVEFAKGANTLAAIDGAGIGFGDAALNAQITYNHASSEFRISKDLHVTPDGSNAGSVKAGTIVATNQLKTTTAEDVVIAEGVAEASMDGVGVSFGGHARVDVKVSGASISHIEMSHPVHATSFTGSLVGNASSATKLETARLINGVSFDGTADISFDTSNVAEGSNLYFTEERAINALRDEVRLESETASYSVKTVFHRDVVEFNQHAAAAMTIETSNLVVGDEVRLVNATGASMTISLENSGSAENFYTDRNNTATPSVTIYSGQILKILKRGASGTFYYSIGL